MQIRNDKEFRKAAKKEKYDGFSFLPVFRRGFFKLEPKLVEDETKLEAFHYKEPGEKIGGNQHGDEYEILLFTNDFQVTDKFSAILVCPAEYVLRMVQHGFYGVVGKKTTSSNNYFSKVEQVMAQ